MNEEILARIDTCEQQNRLLRRRMIIQNIVWVALICGVAVSYAMAAHPTNAVGGGSGVFNRIVAKSIDIVDSAGVVRARLSSDLPNGITCGGRVAHRGAEAAGLMLYDEQGIERGGYVTQYPGSNAMLTLDSKCGQAALFVAGPGPSSASALELWTKDSKIALRSDDDGSRLTIANENEVVYQRPEVQVPSDVCSYYKAHRKKYPDILRERFTKKAIDACLK